MESNPLKYLSLTLPIPLLQERAKYPLNLPCTFFLLTLGTSSLSHLHLISRPRKERKERILEDSLVEVRFYIPGSVTEGMIRDGNGDNKVLKDRLDENGDVILYDADQDLSMEQGEISTQVALDTNGEALSAAALFSETIKQKSDANAATSELIVTFDDILCLTPRGRFQIDMHLEHFRLRGLKRERERS